MPNQFFSPEGDLEKYFLTEYELIDQYIGSELWGWGPNIFGQVGDNTRVTRSTPRQIGTGTNWKQVSAGGYHSLAIKTDGTLWGWGENSGGQVGDNTRASRSTPRQIGTATNWKQVSAGRAMSAAIKTDGTLWTWGWNFPGSLGQGLAYINLPARSTPQQVGTATNWKQVSVGGESSGLSGACCAAIKTDGTLCTWGLNSYGQLGDNSRVTKSAPVQEFTSSTNWVQVSMAENHAMAIKNNGTLWGWGRNDNGQLGQRDLIISRSTPRQEFTSSTNWKQVSASPVNTLALKTDGTLWCWGDNFYGQVGDNTRLDRSTPRQVGTATDWKQISSGALYNMAIKTNGSLWFWGRNDFITTGVSGNNDLISRSTPIQVGYETNWKQVSASISVSAVKTGIEMDTGTITT